MGSWQDLFFSFFLSFFLLNRDKVVVFSHSFFEFPFWVLLILSLYFLIECWFLWSYSGFLVFLVLFLDFSDLGDWVWRGNMAASSASLAGASASDFLRSSTSSFNGVPLRTLGKGKLVLKRRILQLLLSWGRWRSMNIFGLLTLIPMWKVRCWATFPSSSHSRRSQSLSLWILKSLLLICKRRSLM